MYWSVIAGAADELYQYVYLAPIKSEYFDFNDVIINAVGAGLGLLLVRVKNPPCHHFLGKSFFKSYEFISITILISLVILGMLAGSISYGPNPEALFCFMKIEHTQFWHVDYSKIEFHIVRPLEGLLITSLLIVCYSFLEKGSKELKLIS